MTGAAEHTSPVKCYHCGQWCDEQLTKDDKPFCCAGCVSVYEILRENDLCEYYRIDASPGGRQKPVDPDTYAYLDEASVRRKVVDFESSDLVRVTFFLPQIHCLSCIWLLENLHRLSHGVMRAQVNFSRKQISVDFDPRQTTLAQTAALLASVGYAPAVHLGKEDARPATTEKNRLVLKLVVAGFCFGNVMLLSFPEYLGIDAAHDRQLSRWFAYLNLVLSLPVFLFSGMGYLQTAMKSFAQRQINIEVPIAVGLVVLFGRSAWDILTNTGPGYLDSFTGLVFFLLIGRWFQDKTYESLAFDRDFKSYFPLAVHRRTEDGWTPTVVNELRENDVIRVRNQEIIPADCLLNADHATIDYSFVTGEAKPVHVVRGELVYAGGRLSGAPVELLVQKEISQSHLTSLWNHHAFRKSEESRFTKLNDAMARKFTWGVLGLSVMAAVYWFITDPAQVWLVLTSVLMVACPCALALAAPFTYGNMVRAFGNRGFYLKNAHVVERLARINTVVFDKTGTLTTGSASTVTFQGMLTGDEMSYVRSLAAASAHPLSAMIASRLHDVPLRPVEAFQEIPGKGLEGNFDRVLVRMGSPSFTGFSDYPSSVTPSVVVSIQGTVRGYFTVQSTVRPSIKSLMGRLAAYSLHLLSGDHRADEHTMRSVFGDASAMKFNQTPHDKLGFIGDLQTQGKVVLMIGDGLNDAGALRQSDAGIAITDDTGIFTPACDGILQGDRLGSLDAFLMLSKSATRIVKAGFAISVCYNAIALSFAVSGLLTPLIAAVLMPLSSVSVVGFSTLAVRRAVSATKWN